MARYPDACRGAKFVDIDFPDLMVKKRAVVLDTPELRSVFEPFDADAAEHVLLQSSMYSQVGCDLRNTADVQKALSACLGLSDCVFFFVAEVSITYMEVKAPRLFAPLCPSLLRLCVSAPLFSARASFAYTTLTLENNLSETVDTDPELRTRPRELMGLSNGLVLSVKVCMRLPLEHRLSPGHERG